MDENVVKLALALVVGITGVYCSYVISPYLSKGLNVISEQVINIPLSQEETTEYIFCSLSFFVFLGIMSSIFDYDLISIIGSTFIDPLSCNTESILSNYTERIKEELSVLQEMQCVTRFLNNNEYLTTLADTLIFKVDNGSSLINTRFFDCYDAERIKEELSVLQEMQCVTRFLNNNEYLTTLADTLIFKVANSSLILNSDFFEYYDKEHLKNLELFAQISNTELKRLAPIIREYFLFKQIGLNVDYKSIMLKCGINSDYVMNLTLMETLHRGGSGFGGVSEYELFLRNIAVYKLFALHNNLFEGSFLIEDGVLSFNREVYKHWFIDGSIIPYFVIPEVNIYKPFFIDGININKIIKIKEFINSNL